MWPSWASQDFLILVTREYQVEAEDWINWQRQDQRFAGIQEKCKSDIWGSVRRVEEGTRTLLIIAFDKRTLPKSGNFHRG